MQAAQRGQPLVSEALGRGELLGPVELLEVFRNGSRLVRVCDGRRRGELVVVSGSIDLTVAQDWCDPGVVPDAAANYRARELLETRLSERQRDRLQRTGTFWVFTRRSWVRLGTLYDLRVRSSRTPWVERSTCVVTEDFHRRPVDDLWSELLAWLAVDPGGFLRIGNPQPCRTLPPVPSSRSGLLQWLKAGRDQWRALRHAGLETESAHLAFELAVQLRRAGRVSWAAPYAQRAWDQISTEADRFDDAQHVRDAHGALRELAYELA